MGTLLFNEIVPLTCQKNKNEYQALDNNKSKEIAPILDVSYLTKESDLDDD